jgi:hypothetical protein
LRSKCNAKVYLPVTELCDCYPSDLLAEGINKNYTIKHKPGCAYLEQRKELEEGRVVFIMRHDHLGELRHSWLPTFIEALEKTLANPIHPTVWLVLRSPWLDEPPWWESCQ